MVIDSSALVALLLNEADKEGTLEKLASDPTRFISAVTLMESSIVLLSARGPEAVDDLDALIQSMGAEIVGVDRSQAVLARAAYDRFGKGRHPAKPNLGDCFSYALARQLQEPLLFKGNDFGLTDIGVV